MCLTATAIDDQGFRAEAMNETLERSSLGGLRAGAQVNLELPLRAGDRLGGHIVQGHVDGTGTVAAIREEGFARVLEIEPGAAPCALPGREGLGRARRREPDGERARPSTASRSR